MQLPIFYDVDITQPLRATRLEPMLVAKDALANRIGVRLFQGKEAYAPGGACAGFAVRRDGLTLPIPGVVDGNALYIDLPAAAYALPGPLCVGIKNVSEGQETTVFLGTGTVLPGETDKVADPASVLPSVAALITKILEAADAVAVDPSALLTAIAPPEESPAAAAHAVGDAILYNDTLYWVTSPIAPGDLLATGTNLRTSPLGEEVAGLKSALDQTFDLAYQTSPNLLNPDNASAGYVWTDGHHPSSSYINTGKIKVEGGKTYTNQVGEDVSAHNRQKTEFRFVVFYGEDGVTVVGSGAYVTNITVPENAAYLVGSANYTSLERFLEAQPCFVEGTALVDYVPYYAPYTSNVLKAECANTPYILSLIGRQMASAGGKAVFSATAASLPAHTNLICCEACDNKKNESIELTAQFSTFGELTIAHGKGSYMGGYVTITGSKIQVYDSSGALLEEYEHGLTLSGFINVILYTKNDAACRSRISLMTAGGDYTVETSRFYGCRAAVLCSATFAMTNVTMRYVVHDAKESVWVFGDSYLSLGDPNRWATQMVNDGHRHALLCGFGGATSANEIVSFRALMAVAKPRFVVWCLGMNDGDSGAVNASWKACVDEVVAACEAENVTPILATIPNVPSVDNTYKNAYVKSLGCRYVDFAKAVNAESAGASWYAGMLSTDNVHPTALGAKALMRQFLLDVPEVLYEEA